MIDSVFRTKNSYYSQVFLVECKDVVKEKKTPNYINDDTEIASDDSDREDFHDKNSDEKNSNEENHV